MRAPVALAPARHGASAVAGCALRCKAREPAVVGTPSTSMMSLTASRGPSPVVSSVVMKVLMHLRVAHGAPRSPLPRADETQLVGEHDCLHPVAELELGEDARDVCLDSRLGQVKLRGDLGVGAPG